MPDRYGKYQTPNSGTLPEAGRRILKAVYQKEREGGLSKERSAKIAWGAVNRAGFHELTFGKWVRD